MTGTRASPSHVTMSARRVTEARPCCTACTRCLRPGRRVLSYGESPEPAGTHAGLRDEEKPKSRRLNAGATEIVHVLLITERWSGIWKRPPCPWTEPCPPASSQLEPPLRLLCVSTKTEESPTAMDLGAARTR